MRIKNPFKFDIEVAGDFFCGRKQEIADLVEHIENETNIIMFAKRRIGKSSLLKEVFTHHLPKNILKTHIDIYSVSNIRELYLKIVKGIEESLLGFESNLKKLSRLVDKLQNYFANAKVSLVLSGKPQLKIEATEKDYFQAIESLFSHYFEFLADHNLQAVIAIDEFQKIVSLNESEKIEELLRTIANKRVNTSFVYTGSKRNILLAMFNDSGRAFFKLGTEFELPPISKNEFYLWVNERMALKNLRVEISAFEHLYHEADGETRFIQQVCHEIFRLHQNKDIIDLNRIQEIICDVIRKKTYNAQLLNRYTAAQQNTLKLIASSNGVNIYQNDLLSTFGVSKATAQSSLRSLLKEGVIFQDLNGALSFEDVEFKLWLRFISES
ncbi:ATP-binding protein [Aliikangiella sp. G2MR2-5]|uniref:ATP-binding protein n=1 Tax=Aliikangiella sp. G2MR2-5 TaxID=2788943 RepID=UPI0018AB6AD1|nr:ATP-binding protein [Aliikangiella sp. G2MR2-5]